MQRHTHCRPNAQAWAGKGEETRTIPLNGAPNPAQIARYSRD
jgi:hypothetical protein